MQMSGLGTMVCPQTTPHQLTTTTTSTSTSSPLSSIASTSTTTTDPVTPPSTQEQQEVPPPPAEAAPPVQVQPRQAPQIRMNAEGKILYYLKHLIILFIT